MAACSPRISLSLPREPRPPGATGGRIVRPEVTSPALRVRQHPAGPEPNHQSPCAGLRQGLLTCRRASIPRPAPAIPGARVPSLLRSCSPPCRAVPRRTHSASTCHGRSPAARASPERRQGGGMTGSTRRAPVPGRLFVSGSVGGTPSSSVGATWVAGLRARRQRAIAPIQAGEQWTHTRNPCPLRDGSAWTPSAGGGPPRSPHPSPVARISTSMLSALSGLAGACPAAWVRH